MPSGVQVAGTNRSGAKRRRAASENSTADHPEPGRSLPERPLVVAKWHVLTRGTEEPAHSPKKG